MQNSLTGRSIVVTGAFGALGFAVTNAVREAGATVSAIDKIESAKAPPFAAGIQPYGGVDLTSPAADIVFEAIAKRNGGIDGLINVAGGFRWETITDGSLETWDSLYNINVRTALCASKSALPYLLKCAAQSHNGRIVNVGATAAIHAALGMGAYAAAKSGVGRLTEALAAELKDKGITVNAIQPSVIDTPVNRADMPSADFSRWVRPREIADVIVFLLSDKASAISGALIPVTGRV